MLRKKNDIELMKEQINSSFPSITFIKVLGRRTDEIPAFGLDELLDLTFNAIKSNQQNDLFIEVKNKYKIIEENNIKNEIEKIEADIISKLVKEFINQYNSMLNERKFGDYICSAIEKIIKAFSLENELTMNTKSLIKNKVYNVKNILRSFISFYSETVDNYIKEILDIKSLEYLDIQVKVEELTKESILPKYKKNREEFKKMISEFCKNNFYYVAEKFLIYRLFKDLFEILIIKLGQNIFSNIKNYLSSDEIKKYYWNIYLKIFSDYEKVVNEYKKNNNGKLYD